MMMTIKLPRLRMLSLCLCCLVPCVHATRDSLSFNQKTNSAIKALFHEVLKSELKTRFITSNRSISAKEYDYLAQYGCIEASSARIRSLKSGQPPLKTLIEVVSHEDISFDIFYIGNDRQALKAHVDFLQEFLSHPGLDDVLKDPFSRHLKRYCCTVIGWLSAFLQELPGRPFVPGENTQVALKLMIDCLNDWAPLHPLYKKASTMISRDSFDRMRQSVRSYCESPQFEPLLRRYRQEPDTYSSDSIKILLKWSLFWYQQNNNLAPLIIHRGVDEATLIKATQRYLINMLGLIDFRLNQFAKFMEKPLQWAQETQGSSPPDDFTDLISSLEKEWELRINSPMNEIRLEAYQFLTLLRYRVYDDSICDQLQSFNENLSLWHRNFDALSKQLKQSVRDLILTPKEAAATQTCDTNKT